MSWILPQSRSAEPAGRRLAALCARPGVIGAPGAYNGLTALLAREQGFEALYLSGGALTASLGLPDIGLLGLEELAFFTKVVSRASGLPVIVDADTGFGAAINLLRSVYELEQAGAAAIQIEDQESPKRCGHLDGKRLVPPQVMAEKIEAAVRARDTSLIVARTDAAAVEGLAGAVARAQLYREAGADIIFPDALTEPEMFRDFAAAVGGLLLANMTEFGKTPQLTKEAFGALGFKLVIWPVTALRVAAKAEEELYASLARDGTAANWLGRMQSRDALYRTLRYADYERLDSAVAHQAALLRGGAGSGQE